MYLGHLDTVHCYFCNLTISHWKASNDPWVVHIEKSDTCGFLLISRGKAFIEDLKKKGVHKTVSTGLKVSYGVFFLLYLCHIYHVFTLINKNKAHNADFKIAPVLILN